MDWNPVSLAPRSGAVQYEGTNTFFNVFISSSVRPVPSTTQDRGSSAIETGRPVAWRNT